MIKWFVKLCLRMAGWKLVGEKPAHDKFVFIAAPHTSNWDLVFMLAFAILYDLRISWMGKHTLFKPPHGWLMRWLGGVPVDRRAPQGLVKQVAELFAQREHFVLAVPPAGTRSRKEHWKSGFYFIAKEANVPIGLSFLDYSRKEAGFGPVLWPSDDLHADMDKIRAFYEGKMGLYPAMMNPIRLRNEDENTDEKGDARGEKSDAAKEESDAEGEKSSSAQQPAVEEKKGSGEAERKGDAA